jgi:REP element-mobilizing transposase RayT
LNGSGNNSCIVILRPDVAVVRSLVRKWDCADCAVGDVTEYAVSVDSNRIHIISTASQRNVPFKLNTLKWYSAILITKEIGHDWKRRP